MSLSGFTRSINVEHILNLLEDSPSDEDTIVGGNLYVRNHRTANQEDSEVFIINTLGRNANLNLVGAQGSIINPSGNLTIRQRSSGNFIITNGPNDTNRFTLISNGNLGLGTVAPFSKLHLSDTSSNNVLMTVSGSDGTTVFGHRNGYGVVAAHFVSDIVFGWNSAFTLQETMRLKAGGRVLIGSTIDNGIDKLQVSGSIFAHYLKSYLLETRTINLLTEPEGGVIINIGTTTNINLPNFVISHDDGDVQLSNLLEINSRHTNFGVLDSTIFSLDRSTRNTRVHYKLLVGSELDSGLGALQVGGQSYFSGIANFKGSYGALKIYPGGANGTGAIEFTNSSQTSVGFIGSLFSPNGIEYISTSNHRFSQGRVLIGTNTDNGLDILQVSGNIRLSGNVVIPDYYSLNSLIIDTNYINFKANLDESAGISFKVNGESFDRYYLDFDASGNANSGDLSILTRNNTVNNFLTSIRLKRDTGNVVLHQKLGVGNYGTGQYEQPSGILDVRTNGLGQVSFFPEDVSHTVIDADGQFYRSKTGAVVLLNLNAALNSPSTMSGPIDIRHKSNDWTTKGYLTISGGFASGNNTGGISFHTSDTSQMGYIGYANSGIDYYTYSGTHTFQGGRVLIGTSIDSGFETLQVEGAIRVTGNIYAESASISCLDLSSEQIYCTNPSQFRVLSPRFEFWDEEGDFELASISSKGFVPPKKTLAERNALISPDVGSLIYQTDNTPGWYGYNGTIWVQL